MRHMLSVMRSEPHAFGTAHFAYRGKRVREKSDGGCVRSTGSRRCVSGRKFNHTGHPLMEVAENGQAIFLWHPVAFSNIQAIVMPFCCSQYSADKDIEEAVGKSCSEAIARDRC